MNDTNITGLPWTIEPNNDRTIDGLTGFDILREDKRHIVARTFWHKVEEGEFVSGEANAAFIVHCVNTYNDREALIGELVRALKALLSGCLADRTLEYGVKLYRDGIVEARAVLEKAAKGAGG